MRELEKLDIDWLVYCYKAKCTVQWAEERVRKDVCRLNSKLASTTNTQVESSSTNSVAISQSEYDKFPWETLKLLTDFVLNV